MLVKALWVDDQPNDQFIVDADMHGIFIEVRDNVDDGIAELIANPKSYDAIILDAHCVRTQNDDYAKVNTLAYAISRIENLSINLPWFVFSGGDFEGKERIDEIVEAHDYTRFYDDKLWYSKLTERDLLFDKIIEVAQSSSVFKVRKKYEDVINAVPKAEDRLIDLLVAVESGINNDPELMVKARKVLEDIMKYCYEHGLCPYNFGVDQDASLNNCSKFIGNKKMLDYVPQFVQESMRNAVVLVNPAAHTIDIIDKKISSNQAPYIIQSTVFSILTVLHWCKLLPTSPDQIELLRAATTQIKESLQAPQRT